MHGEGEFLRHQFRLEASVIDAVGKEQHRAHIALVISSVHSLEQRRQVRQLVGEIDLVKITDFLTEEVFIDIEISVQVFPKLFKLRQILVFIESGVLAECYGRRIVVRKDNRRRLHRAEFLSYQGVEKQ